LREGWPPCREWTEKKISSVRHKAEDRASDVRQAAYKMEDEYFFDACGVAYSGISFHAE
jgi:hypothetical protein